jgi:predicted lipoprotein with Yx(FWY)xxD motif
LKAKWLLTTLVGAGLLGAACGTVPAAPRPKPATTTIAVVTNPRLGMILVDGRGRTVYMFASDKAVATCYDTCAATWPPVLTTAAPHPGDGAQPYLLGTTVRSDGQSEVTYAGHPLYYFVQDKKTGDTTGQGVDGFGGLWWTVSPAGAAVRQVST